MKKIISIFAVLCMCFCLLAVITSCGHEHTWNEGEVVKAATREADGTKKFTCTECDETKEESYKLVTTITEDQWKAAMALDNFTAELRMNEAAAGEIKASNGSAYMNVGSVSTYVTKKDGITYSVVSMMGKNYGVAMEDLEMTLSGLSVEGEYDDKFSDLTYDEAEKAYYYYDENSLEKSYFYFADGKLEKIFSITGVDVEDLTPSAPVDVESYMLSESIFSDIGSTEVTVPEFEIMG